MDNEPVPANVGSNDGLGAGAEACKLTTHRAIIDAVRGIEKERRDEARARMLDFDRDYYHPHLKAMREACNKLGHKWRFTHHGPLSDPWFCCGVCHANECRRESA